MSMGSDAPAVEQKELVDRCLGLLGVALRPCGPFLEEGVQALNADCEIDTGWLW